MQIPEIDETKLSETMKIIDSISEAFENGSFDENSITLVERLKELSGKDDIDARTFAEYWGWTSLENLAKTVLMPQPVFQGLSNKELSDIIQKISNAEYDEAENDYMLNVLKAETGLSNVSDYIYYPETVGLKNDVSVSAIIEKILLDKNNKNSVIYL